MAKNTEQTKIIKKNCSNYMQFAIMTLSTLKLEVNMSVAAILFFIYGQHLIKRWRVEWKKFSQLSNYVLNIKLI